MRVGAVLAVLCSISLAHAAEFLCTGVEVAPLVPAAKAAQNATIPRFIPAAGRVKALVIFAQFADEGARADRAPGFAADLFDPDLPGSFSHFYQTMSHGLLTVEGDFLPRRYRSDQPAQAYLSHDPTRSGEYGRFAREILDRVDADVDFSQYDGNGDGVADYVFISLRSAPRNFLRGPATGIVGLGFDGFYATDDGVRVGGGARWGTVFAGSGFARTVGVMAHEFGHSLGLPDLFDTSFQVDPDQAPAADGAGIGRWGLMGLGARGWRDGDGPTGFSAWSLEQLGWVGAGNGRLREIAKGSEGLVVADLFAGGAVYKVPLRAESPDNSRIVEDYLLLEQRVRSSHHYNRNLPAEGLLVWHVRGAASSNADEKRKVVDLVCADGLYADAGFPRGQMVDRHRGGDNLDFWAHDASYRRSYGGNEGDATDPFDGARFARLAVDTNPSTNVTGRRLHPAERGVRIENMRREGATMVLDVHPRSWAGTIGDEVKWVGRILVDGDLTVAPTGTLTIGRNSEVRFAGRDRLRAGRDPDLCEFHIQGELVLPRSVRLNPRYPSSGGGTVRFAGATPGDRWYGIAYQPAPGRASQISGSSLQLEDAVFGIVLPGVEPGAAGLAAGAMRVLDGSSPETAGNGDGAPGPGESFQLQLELVNRSLDSYVDARVELAWLPPLVRSTWERDDAAGPLTSPQVDVFSGARVEARLPSLTVGDAARPGQRVEFVVDLTARINGRGTRVWLARDTLAVVLGPGVERAPLQVAVPARPLVEGAVLMEPGAPTLVEVAAAAGVRRVDMVALGWPHLQPVAEKRLFAQGGGRYRGSFEPPRPGQYALLFRVHDRRGQVYFSSERLQGVALVEQWHPLLLILEEGHKTGRVGHGMRSAAAGLGLEMAALELRRLPGALLYGPILEHYLQEGHIVAWAGGAMDAATERAFSRFLARGGRALLLQAPEDTGGEPPLRDQLGIRRLQTRRAAWLRGAEGVDVGNGGFVLSYGELELTAAAQPLLTNAQGAATGLSLDGGGYKAVYLPLDLTWVQVDMIRRVLQQSLAFLQAPSAAAARPPLGVFARQPLPGDPLTGNGAGSFDYDGDGDLDLYIARRFGPNALLRNDGDRCAGADLPCADAGLRLSPVGRAAGVADAGPGRGLAVADYDGDGDLDLYLVNEGPDRLLENRGDGSYVEAGGDLDAAATGASGRSALFFDRDLDGDLDLYVTQVYAANLLFDNLSDNWGGGGLRFVERAAALGLDDRGASKGLTVADYDGDGDPDLFVANQPPGPSRLYRNDGERFAAAVNTGLAYAAGEVGAVFADYDDDGRPDLFVANEKAATRLYRNEGAGRFTQVVKVAGELGAAHVGMAAYDYDNDGDLDLATTAIAADRGGDAIYENRQGAGWRLVGEALGLRPRSEGRAVTYGDYDGDGDQDLVVADARQTQLYLNARADHNWLGVELNGRDTNLQGLGAKAVVWTGATRQHRELQGGYGYCSQRQSALHFGLGPAQAVDSLRITWPDGARSLVRRPTVNQLLQVSHPASKRVAGGPTGALAASLEQNFPNPFNSATSIRFALDRGGPVELAVFNLAGQRVATLVRGVREAGLHAAEWDARGQGSGVYLYRLRTAGGTQTRKLLLLR